MSSGLLIPEIRMANFWGRTLAAWRPIVGLMALIGVGVAASLMFLLPGERGSAQAGEPPPATSGPGDGFRLLLCIGTLDTATRMGYLLFLPFLIHGKGGSESRMRRA